MLRPRVSTLIWARNSMQRSHPTCSRATSTVSTAVPARNLKTHYLFLGLGVVSATGYLLYQQKVYADAHTDLHPRQPNSKLPPPATGLAPGVRGIARAETTASGEDRTTINYYPLSGAPRYLAIGVYDGHNGAHTAHLLSRILSDTVIGALSELYTNYAEHARSQAPMDVASGAYLPAPGAQPNPIPPESEIDDVIRQIFDLTDTVLVHEAARKALGLDDAAYAALQACNAPDAKDVVLPATRVHNLTEAVRGLQFAWSGTCAMLGLFNVDDRSLRVALTGDSRAVLGRRVPTAQGGDYKYEAHALTADQTALNPDEAARLTALHPDEPELLKNGRVVGWGPSRAFGDGPMKWSRAVQAQLHEKVFGEKLRDACKTPPYFTAEPVITTRRDMRKGDFVVFATDGLWECLTSEEVVGLVGQWLEDRGADAKVMDKHGQTHTVRVPLHVDAPMESNRSFAIKKITTPKDTTASKTYLPSELPVIYPPGYEDKTEMYKYWRAEKKFVCEDEQVGTHLMRNALGGANKDLGVALLEIPMPRARKYRDDISIAVVFFD